MPITRHLLCACNYIANLMVCIWRHGGHVGGTTQKNMLLIPWSDQAAWVAKIVRHIPRDWLQTKNSLRFRRTNFIEWAAYVLLLTETINENSTSWAKALCRDYLTSSDESTSLEASNFPLSFQVIKQPIHFVYLGFSIAWCVFFLIQKWWKFPRPVASSIIGGGAHIHTFVFTDHKNNPFQKKLIVQNTSI